MDKSIYSIINDIETKHWWYVVRREIIDKIYSGIYHNANEYILDIGCGSGGNFRILRKRGPVTGIELDKEALEFCKQNNPDGRFFRGSLPMGLPDDILSEKFTLITMFDVLEHIDDENITLSVLKMILNKQGKLLITVPAYQWLYSKMDEMAWHKRRYTKGRLIKLLEANGFRVKYCTYFNTLLFPAAAVFRMLEKKTKRKYTGYELKILPVINSLLILLFRIERLFLLRFCLPYGLSICVIAEINNRIRED